MNGFAMFLFILITTPVITVIVVDLNISILHSRVEERTPFRADWSSALACHSRVVEFGICVWRVWTVLCGMGE